MSNSATEPNANELRPFTLEHLNAALLSGREQMLACYLDEAIGIYCNIRGKSVGPRPERMSDYSGSYGEAHYIACNAIYEVWTIIGKSFDPSRDFKKYFTKALRNKILDLLESGGRTDLLSQPLKSKSKDDAFNKLSKVDADGYWGDSGSEPDNVDPDKQEKIRKFMSDELDALLKYIDGLPEKERTVFLASDFGRAFSSSSDKYGRDYAEALAEKYHTSAGYIRKMAAVEKKKALDAVQKQGFNKQTFTAIELIQAKPNYTETYDKVIEATEKLTPFEQFLLLMHIEDMKKECQNQTISNANTSVMNIINKNLLTEVEQKKFNEVLSYKLFESICFNDYSDKMEIEISPGKKTRIGKKIDITRLKESYDEAKAAERREWEHYHELQRLAKECTEADKKHEILIRIQLQQVKCGVAEQILSSIRELLNNIKGDGITPSIELMGEFSESPSPKVTIYLGNIAGGEERYKNLIPTLIHEMFHAVNYFQSGGSRALREVDEPMVEFAAGVFLKELSKVRVEYDIIAARHKSLVRDKSTSYGEIACYGFGHYLMENAESLSSHSEEEWVKTYSQVSAGVSTNNYDAAEIIDCLYPRYAIESEQDVLFLFEKVIFSASKPMSSGGTNVKHFSHLKVTRRDGTILKTDTDGATFILAILEAGITRVYDLKLPAYGRYLINDKYDAGKTTLAAIQYYEPITGLYIQQHFVPERRKQYLEQISDALGLGWTVELI